MPNALLGGATGGEWVVSVPGSRAMRRAASPTRPPRRSRCRRHRTRSRSSSTASVISVADRPEPDHRAAPGEISGGFDEAGARDLATVLNAGALPVELTRQQVQTVSPTLGSESLRQGIMAGLVGLVLLFLYLLFYYRLLGIVAWFGMSIWAVLALALISLAGIQFGYALTLAGVAGLVISLGVTADSYIVFFERLKDEVRVGQERPGRRAAGVRPLVQDDHRRRRRRGHRGRRSCT